MAKKGGAWKVAYADFITAMMALFMVLWIVGAEQDMLDQLQEYFRNPPSPWERQTGRSIVDAGDYERHLISEEAAAAFDRVSPEILKSLVEEFYRRISISPEEDVPPVEITLTSDGLRLVVFDRKNQPIFLTDSDELTEWGRFLIQNMIWLITRHDFNIVIDGHSFPTDEATLSSEGLWELSTDRAQEVRRVLQYYAVDPIDVRRVSGYGDTRPYEKGEGGGRTNQRITISLSLTGPMVLKDPIFD